MHFDTLLVLVQNPGCVLRAQVTDVLQWIEAA